MLKLREVNLDELDIAMEIIDIGKKHLKEQGIDQWQNGYPDFECIKGDALLKRGFFITDDEEILGYICIDYNGEPAYDNLDGEWASDEKYVVGHRMAMNENSRGRNLSTKIFELIEEMSIARGVHYMRVDTDENNPKMQHVFRKVGFEYRGKIWFDNSEKIAFDKKF